MVDTLRRSGRAKRQTTSVYDEAKKQIAEHVPISSRESRKSPAKGKQEAEAEDDDDDSDDDDGSDSESVEQDEPEDGEEGEEKEDEEEGDSEEEEEFTPKQAKAASPKKKTPVKTKKHAAKKVQIKVGKSMSPKGKASPATKRGPQSALAALAKKVLEPGETVGRSLLASLLNAYKTTNAGKQTNSPDDDRTLYTAQLEHVARKVVEEHKDNANEAQISLLNLLFRSVGGTSETALDDNLILEDMDSEQWGKVITDLVDDMRYTPIDRVLLCADPEGALHAAAVDGKPDETDFSVSASASGVCEYRKIYEEFWFVLGSVALSESYGQDGHGKENDGEAQDTSFATTNRFDAEMVRELILRVVELVTVGQPDVRAAATIAAMQMGLAVLSRTAEVKAKLEVATRQFNAAKTSNSSNRKAEGLSNQIDSLKRTKEDLEELVVGNVMQGVFMHRYRDSNMHIRSFALESLSKMTLMRPDIFLGDKYLKYFGWMLHDKCACVRQAAIAGISAPFKALAERAKSSSRNRVASLDVDKMQNVISKFLLRLIDCVIDTNIKVQEQAMSLLIKLAQRGFMDDMEDDGAWSQINVRALASETSPLVRRDALYFVIEQLEAWDDDEQEASQGDKRWSKDKNASLLQSNETAVVKKLDSLASWIAHSLTDGPIPIDKIRIELANHIVDSLRAMPEHKHIITNWPAILKAIGDDSSTSSQGDGNRVEVAKQRVLVQMLASAAQAEVGAVADSDFVYGDLDECVIDALKTRSVTALDAGTKKKGAQRPSGMTHEVLSVALLQALPNLMVRFKTDPSILGSIGILPRYLLPAVFSLPQRKYDFVSLVKNMTDTFAESADETVLSNIAQSLKFLAKGEHVRSKDVHLQLQRLVSRLAARFVELLDQRASIGDEADIKNANKRNAPKKINSRPSKKSRGQSSQSSRSSQSGVDSDDEGGGHDMGEHGESKDIEYSIFLSLKRLRILAKRMNLSELLNDDSAIETLCSKVAEHTASRLKDRQVISSEEDDNEPTFTVPDIWKNGGKGIHSVVGLEVAEALDFLLVVTLWSRKTVADQDNDVSDDDLVDFHVVKKRDQIVNLVSLCFEQYLPLNDGEELTQKYTEEHIAFSHAVQATASQVMSDLRALFPREWADAASPSLRAMALTEDQQLAAGFVRFFRSVEGKLRLAESEAVSENVDLVREMFLPFARSLATNWKYGNRREAGYALAHITGSGPEAAKIVGAMARVVKKIDPVRLLETQMACLRTSFEYWLNSEPEEPESDRPTDDEMANYDEAQIKYQEKFQLMEQQASRLSQSLGVGKLSDPKLKKPLLGFVREGVRFSFSTDVPGEEPLMPGGRLIFLSLLTKYASWIRRNKDQRSTLLEDLDERENELRVDPEFVDVRQDDLQALEQFRKALGYAVFDAKATSPRSTATSHHSMDGEESGDEGGVDSGSAGPSSSSSKVRGRLSRASSIGSARSSRLSTTQSSLSPLPEEDGPRSSPDDDEDLSPSPGKFRKVAGSQRSGRSSIRSNLSVSSIGRSGTIEEGSGEDSDMSDTQLSS